MTDGYIDSIAEDFARDMADTEVAVKPPVIDERHGVPSASYMRRIANCPNSFKYGKLFDDPGSKDADVGEVDHKALELHPVEGWDAGLDIGDIQTVEMCIEQRDRLIEDWIGDSQFACYKENRLIMTPLQRVFDAENAPPIKIIFSGKADYIAVYGEGALIVDYKTLHGTHDHAAENDQLRSLAVLVYLRYGVTQVRVAIVQPWKGKPTVADFDEAALEASLKWLFLALENERKSTEKDRVAGDWCHFCPARVKCTTFNGPLIEAVSVHSERLESLDPKTARSAMIARANELPNDELAARKKALPWFNWYVNGIEVATMFRAENDPEFAAKYFFIQEGKGIEKVSDVTRVWSACEGFGVTADEFVAGTKVSKKHIRAILRAASKRSGNELKGKALDAAMEQVLTGATTTGAGKKKLVAVGGMIEDDDGEDDE